MPDYSELTIEDLYELHHRLDASVQDARDEMYKVHTMITQKERERDSKRTPSTKPAQRIG